jgi:hypothetical protein
MSAIAIFLKDNSKILEVEKFAISWISLSDCKCCIAKSRDFHFRDSCQYVIYGWWALAQCFVNLQKSTKKPYKIHFQKFLDWFKPYQSGSKKHVEFLNSKLLPDDYKKPMYGKEFDPNYIINFTRVYDLLVN